MLIFGMIQISNNSTTPVRLQMIGVQWLNSAIMIFVMALLNLQE